MTARIDQNYQDLLHRVRLAIQEFETRYNFRASYFSLLWPTLELEFIEGDLSWISQKVVLSQESVRKIKEVTPPFATTREQKMIFDFCFAARLIGELTAKTNEVSREILIAHSIKNLCDQFGKDNFEIAVRDNAHIFEALIRRMIYFQCQKKHGDVDLKCVSSSGIACELTDATHFEGLQKIYLGKIYIQALPNLDKKDIPQGSGLKERGPFHRIEYMVNGAVVSRSYKYILDEIKYIKEDMTSLLKGVKPSMYLLPKQSNIFGSLDGSTLSYMSDVQREELLKRPDYWKHIDLMPAQEEPKVNSNSGSKFTIRMAAAGAASSGTPT